MGQERWSSIWDGRRRPPLAAYPAAWRCGSHLAAYLALLRLGVTLPPLLPVVRWALTPPFHPYPDLGRTLDPGGFFSVALSVALRRPGVTWQPTLWSSDFPRAPEIEHPRPSHPATHNLTRCHHLTRCHPEPKACLPHSQPRQPLLRLVDERLERLVRAPPLA